MFMVLKLIMTIAIARGDPVHLMKTDWAPGGHQPSNQANRHGLWVRRQTAATIHICRLHLLSLLSPKADTHFTVPWRVKGWVDIKAKFHYAILVADRSEAGRRPAASWNLAYHALSSSLAAS